MSRTITPGVAVRSSRLVVAPADHPGRAVAAIEGLLEVSLEERHLVLDHEDLVEVAGHLHERGIGLVQPEIVERSLHDREGRTGGQDAERGARCTEHHLVQPCRPGIGAGEVEPTGEHVVFSVEGGGADEDR
jgi:hypothetical protein